VVLGTFHKSYDRDNAWHIPYFVFDIFPSNSQRNLHFRVSLLGPYHLFWPLKVGWKWYAPFLDEKFLSNSQGSLSTYSAVFFLTAYYYHYFFTNICLICKHGLIDKTGTAGLPSFTQWAKWSSQTLLKVTAGSEARTCVWEPGGKAHGREVLNQQMGATRECRAWLYLQGHSPGAVGLSATAVCAGGLGCHRESCCFLFRHTSIKGGPEPGKRVCLIRTHQCPETGSVGPWQEW